MTDVVIILNQIFIGYPCDGLVIEICLLRYSVLNCLHCILCHVELVVVNTPTVDRPPRLSLIFSPR